METPAVSDPGRALIGRLFDEPYAFEFFQAVRLLEELHPDRAPVGGFGDPHDEVIRFETTSNVGFPASAIQSLTESGDDGPVTMRVNFLGLTGPQGTLPLDYSLYASQRLRSGDSAFKAFLGLFDHRLISLFYLAWARSRAEVGFGAQVDPENPRQDDRRDWLTRHLLDLAGLGSPAVRGKLPFDDTALLHYLGLLSLPSRPATALEQLVSDYFDVDATVEQFIGAWYPLDVPAQTELGDDFGGRTALGLGAVAGDEVWDQQARVRIRIGPLTRAKYDEFLPGGASHEALRALTRFFGNDQFDFEVQLVLAREEAPVFRLGADAPSPLGWATWLRTAPLARDPDDALFTL
jgi:type VI secretion system protein ImpH